MKNSETYFIVFLCWSLTVAAQQTHQSGNYGRMMSAIGNNNQPVQNQNNAGNLPQYPNPNPGYQQPAPAPSQPGYQQPVSAPSQPGYQQPVSAPSHPAPAPSQPGYQQPAPASSQFNPNRNYGSNPNLQNSAQPANQNHNNPAPFFRPKARCECYIATMVSRDSKDLMDLLLPFGTSRSLTTERTDTTCRELQSQCLQHCRIQRQSCLPDGLQSIVPGSTPPISYGSYACKITKEEIRQPAGIFYALNAMYCKDEGFLDSLDDHYCCLEFQHPFVKAEKIRMFSPNCSTEFAPSCNSNETSSDGNSTFSTTTGFSRQDQMNSTIPSIRNSSSELEREVSTTLPSSVGPQQITTSSPVFLPVSSSSPIFVPETSQFFNANTQPFNANTQPFNANTEASTRTETFTTTSFMQFNNQDQNSFTTGAGSAPPESQTAAAVTATSALALNGSVTIFSQSSPQPLVVNNNNG